MWHKKAASKNPDGHQTLGGQGTRKNPDEEIFIFVIGSFRSVACCHKSQSFRAITARFGLLTWSAAALEQQLLYVATTKPAQTRSTAEASSLISLRPATRRHRALALYLILAKRSWDTAARPYITSCFQPLETVSGV